MQGSIVLYNRVYGFMGMALVLLGVAGVTGTRGPFFRGCAAPCNAIPFSGVGGRRCRPTVHRNVDHRTTRVSTVIGGPRTPAFTGAVLTCRGSKRLLSQIAAMFNGLHDTRAGSSLRGVTRRVVPLLDRRDGGVDLGRRLFRHVGIMCNRGSSVRLAPRRAGLLRGTCGKFVHHKTGLRKRTGRGCHRLAGGLDGLALSFDRGGLGRAGGCRLALASRTRLTNLPRDTVRTTTRATQRGKIGN